MSRSWGHSVRLLPDDEREMYARHDWSCGSRNCNEPVTHMLGYRYVTGRAGRISSAEKRACPKHAEAFAKKYEVEMPPEASERFTRTGYMAVSEALAGLAAPPEEQRQ